MKIYKIIDKKGVIHSSTDLSEMQIAFDCMINPEQYDQQEQDLWECEWDGDLELIEVININH